MKDNEGLVWTGLIAQLDPIPDADMIVSATVVCGAGGKWRGVVRKVDFKVGDPCVVFLPDSKLDPEIHFWMTFMKDTNWRVKMRRFRGAPSEVVICKYGSTIAHYQDEEDFPVGYDITGFMGVVKYHKPVPAHLNGMMKGDFPSFIPKTDELNYQRYGDLVDKLVGHPYYITEKCDGSSTTAFNYKGQFGVCSRNWELVEDENNGYWKVARKYNLEQLLPDGIALQWETCGPGIQKNPMGLKEIDGFVFSAYNIEKHCYLTAIELWDLVYELQMFLCQVIRFGKSFSKEGIELLGEGEYENGHQREGVVVRSQENFGVAPISFKVINLDYEL